MTINRHEVRESLYQLAVKESKQSQGSRSSDSVLDIAALRISLCDLAGKIQEAESVAPDDILPTFFSAMALSYLVETANQYCFWATVQRATIYQEIMGGPMPICLRAVHLALSRLFEDSAREINPVAVGNSAAGVVG